MEKAVKVRIYPTEEQAGFLNRQFGCVRLVYNKALGIMQNQYRRHNRSLNAKHDIKKLLPIAKKSRGYSFLAEADSIALQQACINLDKAFKKFFEGNAGYPKFKKKTGKQSSYHISQVTVEQIEGRKRGYIKVPKVSRIKAVLHRKLPEGTLKSITLSKDPSGKYYASLLFKVEATLPKPLTSLQESEIKGVDLGLKDLFIDSDGNKVTNPRFFKLAQRNLRRKQKQLSRKQKGSKRREKARIKVAKCHEKIRHCRNDFQHKHSKQLVDKNQAIVVETLKSKNMMKNRRLAKHIADASWYAYISKIGYKTKHQGKHLAKIDQWYPSTKTCSVCHHKMKSIPLHIREWTCPECGTNHDRDINAAVNIKHQGIVAFKAEGLSVSASGGTIRPSI